MASIIKSQLKLGFVVGTNEGKDIVKSRTITSLQTTLTDELMGNFATLITAVSNYPATAQRVDVKDLD